MSMKRDPLSGLFVIIAVAISIYLFTFSQSIVILFPAFLTIAALGLQDYYKKHKNKEGEIVEDWSYDSEIKTKQFKSDLYYSLIAVAGMLATSLVVGYISYKGLGLSMTNSALFGALMGISEEQLFRGFFLVYFVDTLKSTTIAIVASAMIFGLYHLAVYGGSTTSLLYVFAGGFILAYVTLKTQSLVSSVVAHVINNVLAAVGLVMVADKVVSLTYILPHIHILGVI